MPAPKHNTTKHRTSSDRKPTDARRHDVPTNQKRRRPPAQTRQPVYVEVTAQKEVATTTVVSAMALYACLRHALSGCHETPRPSLPLLSRGLPSKRVHPAHSLAPHLLGSHGASNIFYHAKFQQHKRHIYTSWRYTRTSGTHCRVATETHDRRCRSSVVGYQVNVYLWHTLLRLAVCNMVIFSICWVRRGGVAVWCGGSHARRAGGTRIAPCVKG